jgi:hypothetical protein
VPGFFQCERETLLERRALPSLKEIEERGVHCAQVSTVVSRIAGQIPEDQAFLPPRHKDKGVKPTLESPIFPSHPNPQKIIRKRTTLPARIDTPQKYSAETPP